VDTDAEKTSADVYLLIDLEDYDPQNLTARVYATESGARRAAKRTIELASPHYDMREVEVRDDHASAIAWWQDGVRMMWIERQRVRK